LIVGEITVKAVVDTSGVTAGTQMFTSETKKLETQAKTTGTAVKGMFTGGKQAASDFAGGLGLGVIGFAALGAIAHKVLSAAINEFITAQKEATKLMFSLNNDAEAFQRMNDFADEWMNKTIFDDEDIKAALSFEAAQGRTEEQMKKIVTAAMNLQSVLGGDLLSNVQKLDMTFEGMPGRLGRLDSRIAQLTKTELQNGKAVDIINEKYKGFAEKMATTYAGAWEKFKIKVTNQLGDMVNRIFKLTDRLKNSGSLIISYLQNILAGFLEWAGGAINKVAEIGLSLINLMPGVDIKAGNVDFSKMVEDLKKESEKNRRVYEGGLQENFIGPPAPTGKYAPVKQQIDASVKGKKEEVKEEKKAVDLFKEKVHQAEVFNQLTMELIEQLEDEALTQRNSAATMEEKVQWQEELNALDQRANELVEAEYQSILKVKAALEEERKKREEEEAKTWRKAGNAGEGSLAEAETGMTPAEQFGIVVDLAVQAHDILNQPLDNPLMAMQRMLQIATMIAAALGATQLAGFLGPAGALFGLLGGMFMAKGGPVSGAKPYIVGEKGPELFVPDANGTIIPNFLLELIKMKTDVNSRARWMGGNVSASGDNIFIVQGDLTDYAELKIMRAANKQAKFFKAGTNG
jgi:hypothetical protein